MTAYGPRRFFDASTRRLIFWVLVSVTAHIVVMWFTSLAASNFKGSAATALHVKLTTVVNETREPLAIPGETPELNLPSPPQEMRAAETTPPAPREPADNSSPPLTLPLNIYYSSSEVDTRAEPLNDVDLVYPLVPYQHRVRGVVRLNIFVNEQGGIDKVAVVESRPSGVFDEAALSAVGALKFSPAIKNGLPVKNRKTIEVTFDPYEKINTP
jgi:TonB family protein